MISPKIVPTDLIFFLLTSKKCHILCCPAKPRSKFPCTILLAAVSEQPWYRNFSVFIFNRLLKSSRCARYCLYHRPFWIRSIWFILLLAEVPDVSRDNLIVRIWRKRKRRRYGLLLVSSNSPWKISLRITVMSLFGERFKLFLD